MTLEMLAQLQAILREMGGGYDITIAGGAVRDLLFGKPVKDIDAFIVRSREEDVYEEAPQRYDALRIATALDAELVTTSESGYPDGEQVYATYELTLRDRAGLLKLPTINLIFVEDFEAALNEFPDTISQVYLGDGGEPVFSDSFREALVGNSNVVHTRLLPDNKRVRRLSEKYGSMEWVVVAADSPKLEWA